MIERHAFNSRWWGSDVGVVRDPAFFSLPPDERRQVLAPWSWVEHRAPLEPARAVALGASGFRAVDTQLPFRIGFARVPSSPSLEALTVRFADEEPFAIDAGELQDFAHERFLALPGATPERVNARYALWSADLLARAPEHCLAVLADGEVQGWFLGERTSAGLSLTLAMLRRGARITGLHLYQRALLAHRDRGARVGFAAFSATNTAVHNVYVALGARFLAPETAWLWHPAFAATTP